jgi:tripartite-type tricarboxylate transporter receptor subunit TctC
MVAKAMLGLRRTDKSRELPVRILTLLLGVHAAAAALIAVPQARAQDFYRGKSLTLFAGQPPGGGIDSEMRLVAQYFGRHIPGEPAVVPRNMPGAGGLILGNNLYSVSKPDGLTLGMPGRTGFVLAPIISAADTKYDLRKFTWIGSSASSNLVLWMRRQASIKSFDDLRRANRQIIIAGSGSTTSNSIIPEVLAKYENMPVKVVRGYTGIIDAVLAVERGEADGVLCQRASIRSDMLSSGAVVPVFQLFDMEPGLPVLERLVGNPREKALLEFLSAPQRLGLTVIAPPGLPEELTRTLRQSYLKMVASREYHDEAVKRGFDVGRPNTGEEIAAYVTDTLLNFPSETIREYRSYVEKQ